MRFVRLHARRFGPMRERTLELDGDALVVFGRNESGKSSFRAAVETIVYGFDPASREKHPLWLWDGGAGGDLALEAELRLDSGEVQRVERVLQSTGKLRIAAAGEAFGGRREGNRPLAWASLPREVFQAIYSLELADLGALERDVQGHVDDLLLPESPGLELRPVTEVRAALRDDAQRLWRPDGRGRPRARELRERLADAKRRAHEAAAADEALRSARSELASLEARLRELEAGRSALAREREEAPLVQELLAHEHRLREGAAPVDLAPLGERPLEDPRELARELEPLETAERLHAARLAREPLALDAPQRALLDRAAALEAAIARAARDASDAERAEELGRRADELRAGEERELARALGAAPDAARRAAAGALDLDGLRAAHAAWARACDAHAATSTAAARLPAGLLVAAPAGAAALLAGVLLESRGATAFGAVLLVLAVLGVVLRAARPSAPPPAAPVRLDAALEGLGVARELRATPAELARVLDALERARQAAADAARCESEAARLAGAAGEAERIARGLCAELGFDPAGGPEERAARMREALEQARRRERDAQRDRDERARAGEALEASAPRLAALRAHRDAVHAVLERAEPGGGELGARWERVSERIREATFARRRAGELRSDPRVARALARTGGPEAAAASDPERLDAALRACDDELAQLRERIGRLRQRLDADPGSQRAAAQDEIEALSEELAEVERERDRLALLEAIVARAEAAFRDAHQPDVLRRASEYLRRVTDGRYGRLDYDPRERRLTVTPSERGEPLPVGKPLSSGTLDQIFLCLRLGLLDHLDEDRERLPLILDDALLRTDDVRRGELYALLAHAARRRQIFLLTCHDAIAREAEDALKLRRIALSA